MADLRQCIGSTRFGIEPHDAPVDDFPSQPSQKDGLGRMCKPHWNAYTAGLARDAKARKAAAAGEASRPAESTTDPREAEVAATAPPPKRTQRAPIATPVAAGQEDAG
jgi:hypothetical protein